MWPLRLKSGALWGLRLKTCFYELNVNAATGCVVSVCHRSDEALWWWWWSLRSRLKERERQTSCVLAWGRASLFTGGTRQSIHCSTGDKRDTVMQLQRLYHKTEKTNMYPNKLWYIINKYFSLFYYTVPETYILNCWLLWLIISTVQPGIKTVSRVWTYKLLYASSYLKPLHHMCPS